MIVLMMIMLCKVNNFSWITQQEIRGTLVGVRILWYLCITGGGTAVCCV